MRLIDADGLRKWLKKIPIHDLSDGNGLCRVIFEEDFARSMHMFDGNTIEVVRCKDCKWYVKYREIPPFCDNPICGMQHPYDETFCCYGERRDDD